MAEFAGVFCLWRALEWRRNWLLWMASTLALQSALGSRPPRTQESQSENTDTNEEIPGLLGIDESETDEETPTLGTGDASSTDDNMPGLTQQ